MGEEHSEPLLLRRCENPHRQSEVLNRKPLGFENRDLVRCRSAGSAANQDLPQFHPLAGMGPPFFQERKEIAGFRKGRGNRIDADQTATPQGFLAQFSANEGIGTGRVDMDSRRETSGVEHWVGRCRDSPDDVGPFNRRRRRIRRLDRNRQSFTHALAELRQPIHPSGMDSDPLDGPDGTHRA